MTRSRIVGLVLLLVGLAAAAYFVLLRGPAPVSELGKLLKRKPRSLVLITVDTTRPDHLEPYGAENVETPRLQRLAREGIVMEKAYAVAPLTLPAHTSILTGLYPPQTGVRNNGTHFVPAELTTLTERLSEEGYRTGAFVSAAVLERRYGLDQGFEIYDDDLSKFRVRNPRIVPERPGEATVEAARGWLDTLAVDERFFLYGEDVDFCAAVRALGRHVLYAPAIEVVHHRGRSGQSAPARTATAYRRSHLAFYRKHHPAWHPVLRAYLRVRGKLPPGE